MDGIMGRKKGGKNKIDRNTPEKLKDKLKNRCSVDEVTGCHNYTGFKNDDGYGAYNINKKTVLIHRLSYELYVGKIPDGMLVCHTCDNPSCFNHEHLFIGTHQDNTDDMFSKGRYKHGDNHGERNSTTKLTDDNVLCIKQIFKEGCNLKQVGELYGVSASTLCDIRKGRTWTHIQA